MLGRSIAYTECGGGAPCGNPQLKAVLIGSGVAIGDESWIARKDEIGKVDPAFHRQRRQSCLGDRQQM